MVDDFEGEEGKVEGREVEGVEGEEKGKIPVRPAYGEMKEVSRRTIMKREDEEKKREKKERDKETEELKKRVRELSDSLESVREQLRVFGENVKEVSGLGRELKEIRESFQGLRDSLFGMGRVVEGLGNELRSVVESVKQLSGKTVSDYGKAGVEEVKRMFEDLKEKIIDMEIEFLRERRRWYERDKRQVEGTRYLERQLVLEREREIGSLRRAVEEMRVGARLVREEIVEMGMGALFGPLADVLVEKLRVGRIMDAFVGYVLDIRKFFKRREGYGEELKNVREISVAGNVKVDYGKGVSAESVSVKTEEEVKVEGRRGIRDLFRDRRDRGLASTVLEWIGLGSVLRKAGVLGRLFRSLLPVIGKYGLLSAGAVMGLEDIVRGYREGGVIESVKRFFVGREGSTLVARVIRNVLKYGAVGTAIGMGFGGVGSIVGGAIGGLTGLIVAVFKNQVMEAGKKIRDFVTGAFGFLFDKKNYQRFEKGLKDFVKKLGESIKDFDFSVGRFVRGVVNFIRELFTFTKESFVSGIESIKESVEKGVEKIKESGRRVRENIEEFGESVKEGAKELGDKVKRGLGWLSARFESGARAEEDLQRNLMKVGRIGDEVAIGPWQMIESTFREWLRSIGEEARFEKLRFGSQEFMKEYQKLINELGPEKVVQLQREFLVETHVKPMLRDLERKIGVGKQLWERDSRAVKEMLFSIAVQYGKYGAELIKKGLEGLSPEEVIGLSDEEVIRLIMEVKKREVDRFFRSKSRRIRESIRKRFEEEERILLELERQEERQRRMKRVMPSGVGRVREPGIDKVGLAEMPELEAGRVVAERRVGVAERREREERAGYRDIKERLPVAVVDKGAIDRVPVAVDDVGVFLLQLGLV